MSKTRSQKEVAVSALTDKFRRASAVVFATFAKLKVADVTALRRECRAAGVDYQVAKKTLLNRSLADSGISGVDPKAMDGGVASIFGYGDQVLAAKMIHTFARTHEGLVITGGLLDGQFMPAASIVGLAQLPSRDELLAKAVGSMAAPLSGFVNVLQGNLRGLVYTLSAIRDAKSA